MIFMNDNMNIKKSLETTVFKETKFTIENKQAVFAKTTQKRREIYILPILISCLFVAIIGSIGVYFGKELLSDDNTLVSMGGNQPIDMQPLEENGNKLFELTELEEQVYNNFKINFDLKELVNLEPISIAKLYVYAGYYQDYGLEYALYTDREGHIQWSDEEDKNIPISHRGNQDQIIETFNNIDKGTFIQTSEYEGYIEFTPTDNDDIKSGFSMIKNDNGIWQVAFMPIQ